MSVKMVPDNLRIVRQRIARACEKTGRQPEEISLVCVTKEASPEQMLEAIGAGVRIVGENRIQSAVPKYRAIGDRVAWHLVGHLQTNKAKDAVRIFSLIHSVDSLHLAEAIDKEAKKIGKVQDVLLQVNTSGEATKFGVTAEDLTGLIMKISASYHNISIKGLMTMAPESSDEALVRPCFRELRQLRDSVNTILQKDLAVLSMGMTNDFETAIEEGSTMVRIGRAIFNGIY